MIETVSAIAAASEAGAPAALSAAAPAASPGVDFVAHIDQRFEEVNGQLLRAEAGARDFAAGRAVSLQQLLIDSEHARLSLQLLMQIRTRILEAYQDLMRMQI